MNQKILWGLRILLLILLVAWMYVIFSMSAQDGKKSSGTSEKVCREIAHVTVKDFEKMTEPAKQQVVGKMQRPVRKMGHMTEYAVLAVIFSALFLTFSKLRKKGLWALCSFVGGALYASSDELHQRFIAGRAGQITDVFIDMGGFCIGLLIVTLVFGIIFLIRKKKQNHLPV
ncbi:MAG: VanZ family protein [Lachnospiraceae bacterium]|nr:VanZ family protein [Lachnospiraceae bacterium]